LAPAGHYNSAGYHMLCPVICIVYEAGDQVHLVLVSDDFLDQTGAY